MEVAFAALGVLGPLHLLKVCVKVVYLPLLQQMLFVLHSLLLEQLRDVAGAQYRFNEKPRNQV